MKFSINWLKQYLNTSVTSEEIYAALNKYGLEVEGVENLAAKYRDFIVAEIISAVPHPQAEKLKVCVVDDGKQKLQIVCGAANARAGIKVVLAPVGAVIPANGMVIKISKIRGVESYGMLCSADELMLTSEEQDGIIELTADAEIGNKFADIAGLNDVIFDVSITPNRGDWASVYGIARELAACGYGELIKHNETIEASNKEPPFGIDIQDEVNCWGFSACYIENINNHSSSLQQISQHLRNIGFNPKNSLVDISNFCMLSSGRPNHIYDADKIKGQITVRKASSGEKFVAIGGAEYELDNNITVVADAEKILAVAGLIGGELSKVDANTRNIIIEMAVFSPLSVISAGRKLNINTDARFRFERRVDYANTEVALGQLVNMVHKYCGGTVYKPLSVGCYPYPYPQVIDFDYTTINKLTGVAVGHEQAIAILTKLGFDCQDGKINIPSWRQGDIIGGADIVEEIIRIYGWENIAPIAFTAGQAPVLQCEISDTWRQALLARGLDELITWSFFAQDDLMHMGQVGDAFVLQNPISVELAAMRTSIIPNFLKVTARNIARGQENLCFFEIGHIYDVQFSSMQTPVISAMRSGICNHNSVHKDARTYDFFDIKADFLALMAQNNLREEQLSWQMTAPSYYHPGRSAEIKLGKKLIGYCGQLHPDFLHKYGIEQPVMALEIFTEALPKQKLKLAKAKLVLNNLQPVIRDFAFVIDEGISAAQLQRVIAQTLAEMRVIQIQIFDVYTGKGVADGKKSIAVSVKLQPQHGNFTDDDIAAICSKINNAVASQLGASLRGARI